MLEYRLFTVVLRLVTSSKKERKVKRNKTPQKLMFYALSHVKGIFQLQFFFSFFRLSVALFFPRISFRYVGSTIYS